MAEQIRVVEMDRVNLDGKFYTRKKISLLNPPKVDVMGNLHKEFSRAQVKEAKAKYKLSKIQES